jgi:AbrB family looped-hinge helix DNA binding protein
MRPQMFGRELVRKQKDKMETYANEKGQIALPAALRQKYGIKSGTRIIVTDIGNSIVLKPVTEQYLKTLQGSLKGKGGLKVLLNERRMERK